MEAIELFPGNHKFEAKINHTESIQTFNLVPNVAEDIEFNPTLVNMDYAGNVKWKYNNYYYTDVTPDYYMFPGTYKFKFSGNNSPTIIRDIGISGCEYGGNVYAFKVMDEAGNGIENVPIEWHYNTNYNTTWENIGTTDANGMLVSIGDVTKTGSQPFRAEYNKTKQTKLTSGYAEFQTTVATALVENCDQDPISGVDIDFLWHSNYTGNNWRINVGTTGNDGKAFIELFPGNHKFEAKVNHTKSIQTFDLEANEVVDIEFNPTVVNMNYAGDVKWKYNNYYYTDVTPDYLMFPGTYKFRFSGANDFTGTYDLEVSDCEFGGNVYVFEVKNEAGEGIADVPIEWHYNTNYDTKWENIGTTDANGMLVSLGDVWKTGKQPFKAVLNKTSQRKETTGYTEFETVTATALVLDHMGNPLEGKEVRFQHHSGYANYYVGLGDTDADGKASVELFPGEYDFKAFVNKTTSEKTFTLSYDMPVDVTFQTELATALVQNCKEEPIPEVLVEYLWHNSYTNDGYRINVGTTGNDGKASIELFESDNLKFRAKLNHTKSIQTFDLVANEVVDVVFNPTLVDLGDDVEWKYNNYYYTDVTSGYYMFPGTYNFRVDGEYINGVEVSDCEFTEIPNDNDGEGNVGGGTKSGIIGKITDDVVPEFSYKLYPVPARTELNVNVTFEAKEKVHVQVVDISGRVMKQDVWMLNKGLNTMKVDVNDLVDEQYIFLLKSDGRVIKDKFSVFKN